MSDEQYRVAVYGASGALGRAILVALEGEGVPVAELLVAGASRTAGGEVPWRGQSLRLQMPPALDAASGDLAILATPDEGAQARRELLVAEGALVIDASPSGRRDPSVPLVWPTLNAEVLSDHGGALAVPGAMSSTLAPVLAAAQSVGVLARIDAVALASATLAGRAGEESLSQQTLALLNYRLPDIGALGGILAFNVLAGSYASDAAGDPVEDELQAELSRLLPDLAHVPARLTVIRVPVFAGLALAVTLTFEGDGPSPRELREALARRPDVTVADHHLALRDAIEEDHVLVGPVRGDPDGRLRLFLVADPLQRVAGAVGTLVDRIIAEDLW